MQKAPATDSKGKSSTRESVPDTSDSYERSNPEHESPQGEMGFPDGVKPTQPESSKSSSNKPTDEPDAATEKPVHRVPKTRPESE